MVETAQGLSHARNRGLAESHGSVVAYIDDDAKARSNWASAIIEFYDRVPEADAVGGPYQSHAAQLLPSWFPLDYGTWSLGEFEGELRAETLRVAASARGRGVFVIGRISIEEGAVLDGDLQSPGEPDAAPVLHAVTAPAAEEPAEPEGMEQVAAIAPA